MALTDFLSAVSRSRRFLRALDRIAAAQEAQVALLRRIADQVAPLPPEITEADLRASGPSYTREEEQARMLEYAEKVYRETGRYPTDDEMVDWLDGVATGQGEAVR